MAYRRDTTSAIAWRKWLQRHQLELEACGLPELVTSDQDHWYDFLDHGFLDHHEDPAHFNVEKLPGAQRRALYKFLRRELSEEDRQSTRVFSLLKSMLGDAARDN